MFIVRVQGTNELVAMCSRYEDAAVFLTPSKLDGVSYTIEDTEESKYYENMYQTLQDGYGEGQPR